LSNPFCSNIAFTKTTYNFTRPHMRYVRTATRS